jgi:hypothetical protein
MPAPTLRHLSEMLPTTGVEISASIIAKDTDFKFASDNKRIKFSLSSTMLSPLLKYPTLRFEI